MKTITRTKIYLPLAGMILTLALSIAAAAENPPPSCTGFTPGCFKGTFQGNDAPGTPPLQSITGSGTYVGQFLSIPVAGSPGSAQWISANGDSIYTTYFGRLDGLVDAAPCQVVGAQPEDGYAVITQFHTI